MFNYNLFILFWGIPKIFTFSEHRMGAFDSGLPFNSNQNLWVREVRNIAEKDNPCQNVASESEYVPFQMPRNDSFEWMMLKRALLGDEGNVIVSPFFVKLILILLAEAVGLQSGTQNELAAILPNFSSSARRHYKEILDSLKEKSIEYDLNFGTQLFVDEFIDPSLRYKAILQSYFDADILQLNFRDLDQSVEIINNWSTDITYGHSKNLVSRDHLQSAVILILNIIYFNGKWKSPFDKSNIFDLVFFSDSTIPVTFMTQTENFYYTESKERNLKAIRMPYKGIKLSMTLLLPNSNLNLDQLIREIDGDDLKELQRLMNKTEVKVTIPKFKFDYTNNLNDILKSMGINEIFTLKAALQLLVRPRSSGEVRNKLQVSHIIQKVSLIVNEEGTTASVDTPIDVPDKYCGNAKEFTANRPFVFFIEDETTGALLYAGKVLYPSN